VWPLLRSTPFAFRGFRLRRRDTNLSFSVTTNGNPGTLGGGPRADYLGGRIIVKDYANRLWFDPSVFGRPKDGSLGSTGRNFLRCRGFTNFDLSLFKDFKFTERLKLQYHTEFFNIFNHLEWFGVNSSISNVANSGGQVTDPGTFGQLNLTRDGAQDSDGVETYILSAGRIGSGE
jgi:hypothetical protein